MNINLNLEKKIILTLDAGGTNFVFSAIQGNKEIVEAVNHPANAHNLEKCLSTIIQGFESVNNQLPEKASAISFAFPGPADYAKGIIGNLPNFKAFNDGVALGVSLDNLTSSLKVYPNPNNGVFTLEVQNSAAIALNISVTNIQGQTIYQNTVESVMNHRQTINLTGFAKGLYFLKVNHKVTKLLVK